MWDDGVLGLLEGTVVTVIMNLRQIVKTTVLVTITQTIHLCGVQGSSVGHKQSLNIK